MARTCLGVIAVGMLALLTGCATKSTEMSAAAMKPQRPPELDKLDVFVGKWEDSGEGTIEGKPSKFTGMGTNVWEVDRNVLVGRGEMEMGEMGKMSGLSMWMWDPKAKKYTTFWVDSMGSVAHGTAWYDEATRTWKSEGKGRNPKGETTVGEGTTTFSDNNTMNWTYTEWNSWKTKKMVELKGMSKRRP